MLLAPVRRLLSCRREAVEELVMRGSVLSGLSGRPGRQCVSYAARQRDSPWPALELGGEV